jgi:small-conductance mechanosensitive channel
MNYTTWAFALTTFFCIAFFLYIAWHARPTKNFLNALAMTLLLLLSVHAFLAASGFYLVTNGLPPRFIFAPVPTTLILILLFAFNKKRFAGSLSLRLLTLLHVVRIPVEFVLFLLYKEGMIPQLMTFEGRNFDILSGLTAPVIVWLAFRNGKTNRVLLIVWNFIALGLLINIVTNAILSLPTSFQQFAFDQPNRAVLYFPFIWLPAIIVPIVFVSHVLSLWESFKPAEKKKV